MGAEHEQLVRDLFEAIETKATAEVVGTFWHPDAEQVELPSLMRPAGHRRPLHEMLEGYAAGGALLAEQSYDVHTVVDDGDRLAVQLRWTATTAVDAGALPAGSELVAHIAAFYEFRDGLILRQSSYDCYEPLPTGTAASQRKEAAMPGGKSPGPSVKDKELYEELRGEGNSKEKSARIANAAAGSSRSKVGRKGGKSGDYDDWTVDDLRKRAREIGVEGRSKMGKGELIKALRDH